MIIAPIAKSDDSTISSLGDYHQISSTQNVLYVDDCEGIYYVFQGDDTLYRLEEYGELTLFSET